MNRRKRTKTFERNMLNNLNNHGTTGAKDAAPHQAAAIATWNRWVKTSSSPR